METPRDHFETALAVAEKGYVAIPCYPGTKVPCVRWKRWQTARPDEDLYRRWFRGTRNNIAIITTGLVIFDCDDPAKAELVLKECGNTPHRLRTPGGGIHLGYRRRNGVEVRNRVKIRGLDIDIRTDGGIEMIPDSETEDGAYLWLGEGLFAREELPVAKVGWTRSRVRRRAKRMLDQSGVLGSVQGSIKFPEQYCLRIPSVQGQNGSRGLVRVVCVLRDAGRSPQQIFDFVKGVWGPACCRPEWSDREIWHAIDRHCGGT